MEEKIKWLLEHKYNLFHADVINSALHNGKVTLENFRRGCVAIETAEENDDDEFEPDWFNLSIREKYDAFVKEHGCEPRYAEVSVIFTDDKSRVDGYIIAMVQDEETERMDECIFFYCDSVDDVEGLTKKGCEDFTVIPESVEFLNHI